MDPDPSDWREARRFRAFELKQKGWRQTDIAEALGVSDSSVSHWMKKAREGGKEALKTSQGGAQDVSTARTPAEADRRAAV